MKNMVFDYINAKKEMNVPEDVLLTLEKEARGEFPNDDMMMELHVLRALHAYANSSRCFPEVNN
jgi:hypothetical protein